MAGTPWGFFLSLCLCGLLFYPALLVASILFPAAGLRIASRTVVVHIEVTYRPRQVVLSEGGPNDQTPPHRLLLDGTPVWEAPERGTLKTWVVLENLTPGPHTLVLEAWAGGRRVRHQVRFEVVDEPTVWQLQSWPREERPLFWDAQGRAWGRGASAWSAGVRLRGLSAQAREYLVQNPRGLAYIDAQGKMTLYTRAGASFPVPAYEFTAPFAELRFVPGWYTIGYLEPEDEDTLQGHLATARWEGGDLPLQALPEGFGNAGAASVDERGLWVYFDGTPARPAVFFLDFEKMDESRFWPTPTDQGKWAGWGFWVAPDAVYRLAPKAGWQRLPDLPVVLPPALEKYFEDYTRDVFTETTSWLQARPCGDAIWISAAWYLAQGKWPYLARYQDGRWQVVDPPTPMGRFFLYCLQGQLWMVNTAGTGQPPSAEQVRVWGWWLNRNLPDRVLYEQGRGHTYRWEDGAWQEVPAVPLVNPWEIRPHPAGPVMTVFDPDRDMVWAALPVVPKR